MKRIITSLLLFLVVMCSYAQTKRYYCEVKGIEKELSSGLKIIFDFGNQVIWLKKDGNFNKHIHQHMVVTLSYIGYSIKMQSP